MIRRKKTDVIKGPIELVLPSEYGVYVSHQVVSEPPLSVDVRLTVTHTIAQTVAHV